MLRRRFLFLLFVAGLWLSAALIWFHDGDTSTRTLPVLHLSVFYLLHFGTYFSGGVLAFLYRDKLMFHWSLFLLALFLWMGLYLLPWTQSLLHPDVIHCLWYLAIPYVVLYLSFLPGWLNRFGRLGDLSYGLYIYGMPVQQALLSFFTLKLAGFPFMLLSFACLIPLAALSWYFVEKPALRWKSNPPRIPWLTTTSNRIIKNQPTREAN